MAENTNITEQQKKEKVDEEKEEKEESTCSMLNRYSKNERKAILLGTFYITLGSLGDFMGPKFIGWSIDFIDCGDFVSLRLYMLYFAIVIILSSVFAGLRARHMNLISDRIARDLRNEVFDKILICDTKFFDRKENMTGALLSRINSDIETIKNVLGSNVSMVFRGGSLVIAIMIQMLIINLKLAGITFAALLISLSSICSYANQMKALYKEISKEKSLMTADAHESFTNIKTVKAFAAEEMEINKMISGNERIYKAGMKKVIKSAAFGLLQQIGMYGALTTICYVSYELYQKNEITIGDITQYIFYTQLLIFQFWMISFVIGNVMGIKGVNASFTKIRNEIPEILNQEGEIIENDSEVTGHLALENVKFCYPEKPDVLALDGISFEVNNDKKRVIALVGSSGCGKSSCVAILKQLYLPKEGRVLFNGRDIKTLNSDWYHSQVAIVQQEPILFQDTIRNNILYGIQDKLLKDKSEEEIIQMLDFTCKQANVYDFIHDMNQFPDGYETKIGSKGIQLSGGQKQRVAIARALIRQPKVLLLDEATSALDTESEHQVQTAINKLIQLGQQTVIIVAHRLSTVKDADEILVLNKGSIVERGKHDELVALEGVYKKLVQRQLVTENLQALEEAEKTE